MWSIRLMTPLHFDHRVAYFTPTKQDVRAEGTLRWAELISHITRTCVSVCVSDLGSPALYELCDLGHMESAQVKVM